MRHTTVLFDFDGTLADSAHTFWLTINAVAPEFGFAPVTEEEIPQLRQMSVRQLLVQRAGIQLWNVLKMRRLERRMREEFRNHADGIRLFEHVPQLLKELREQELRLGIVTSNVRDVVGATLARDSVAVDFIHAGSSFMGKARAITETLKEHSLASERTIYVGDELRDVEACKKVGIDMIAVGWGFNSSEVLREAGVEVVSSPSELLGMLRR